MGDSEYYRDKFFAGSGRDKQGGPTAKELDAYERKQNAGIYTADKGLPPKNPDMGSSPPASKAVKKYAKGGSIDGIAQRGKTRGRMC